jgi:uncharacterized membrane protein YjgN (DUF898 family)
VRVLDEPGFEFRVPPQEFKVQMLLVCQLLLEMGELRVETVYLLGLSIDSALLLVWGWLTINSLRAQCLLKQTNEGRRSFQISLIDLISSRHQRSRQQASREEKFVATETNGLVSRRSLFC